MSLKAKLEAVIYAAEEPVSLAQLATLFAEEAWEWKAEQTVVEPMEAASAETVEPATPLQEVLPDLTAPTAGANGVTAVPEDGAGNVETDGPAAGESEADAAEPSGAEVAEPDPAQAEAEVRRLARQREREARDAIKSLLDELIADYAADSRGIEIREIAGGYRMATKPECHDAVRAFIKGQKPPLKLSLPALETLAVIAYKQPITAPEVNEIRGVDSSGVFGSLLARKLIATAGRKQVLGRPILYKTTREFLLRFGLKDVSELPSMEEFEKMAASELEEPEAASEGSAIGAAEFNPDPSVENDENEAEAGDKTESTAAAEPLSTQDPEPSPEIQPATEPESRAESESERAPEPAADAASATPHRGAE